MNMQLGKRPMTIQVPMMEKIIWNHYKIKPESPLSLSNKSKETTQKEFKYWWLKLLKLVIILVSMHFPLYLFLFQLHSLSFNSKWLSVISESGNISDLYGIIHLQLSLFYQFMQSPLIFIINYCTNHKQFNNQIVALIYIYHIIVFNLRCF